ncbi:periplasmic heavy metal sensor [bacterium]|nr:periplasmic heavy metal sensor [bacterium]
MKQTAVITAAVLILAGTAIAQQGRGMGMRRDGFTGPGRGQGRHMLDLSEEQQAKWDEIHLAQMKEMTAFQNKLAEKEVKLRTLRTADIIDSKAIFAVIEEIGRLKTDMAKARESFRLTLREELTEDQRVVFDSRTVRGGHGGRGGHGRGGYMDRGKRAGSGVMRGR